MELKNNIIVGSLVLIAISVAYFLLVHIPKQQEITLRKQVYELCRKEWDEMSKEAGESFARMWATGQITQEEMAQRTVDLASQQDRALQFCVEKRIKEYRK